MGLSPESPEDEAGIKRAAENSEQNLFLDTCYLVQFPVYSCPILLYIKI